MLSVPPRTAAAFVAAPPVPGDALLHAVRMRAVATLVPAATQALVLEVITSSFGCLAGRQADTPACDSCK